MVAFFTSFDAVMHYVTEWKYMYDFLSSFQIRTSKILGYSVGNELGVKFSGWVLA